MKQIAVGLIETGTMTLVAFLSSAASARGEAGLTPQACTARNAQFVHDPVNVSLELLNAPAGKDCWPAVIRSEPALESLLAVVRRGSIPAARYLVRHLPELDGGNLEDAHVALGEFSTYHMKGLMEFVLHGTLTERDLTHALTMLPLSMSDNPKAQVAELKRRRVEIERLSDPALRANRSGGSATGTRGMNAPAWKFQSKRPGQAHTP